MGMYKYIRKTFEKEYHEREQIYRQRLALWRSAGAIEKVERPTNLSRARMLGYKAKQGIIIVRVRLTRGMRKRRKPSGGRKPGKNVRYLAPGVSLRHTAEQRANRKFSNMDVLNSYWVGADGQKKYFEVILVDAKLAGMNLARTRAYRGMTSAAKKMRGFRR
ncbi:50S ribosomal protein L15e [Candidatus Micrarchaeota archaeon CG10_big_fil_rev_8_21_14_0_10_45_29]|nr:MAG: 50S ribosomal protein L15e [Candidatus Micrarchaeota archaeon CG10_big_fil_rev_8_21_14_0_10_45_29]